MPMTVRSSETCFQRRKEKMMKKQPRCTTHHNAQSCRAYYLWMNNDWMHVADRVSSSMVRRAMQELEL